MSWLVVTLCNPRVLGLVWLGCLNNSFQCLCIELKTVGLKKTCLVMVFFIKSLSYVTHFKVFKY